MNFSEENFDRIRSDFPILSQTIGTRPLVYLDNAATTQVPDPVLETIMRHYHTDNANVHRGIHTLSERSTAALEQAREKARAFINAGDGSEIVFTKGTTDAINTAARALESTIESDSTIVVSALEHHANFVPWQQLCERTGAHFQVIPLDEHADVDLSELEKVLATQKVALVAMTQVSNVTGTVNPIGEIVSLAHANGARMLVDAAQSIRHESVDVRALDCDLLAFSGHKMMAPTGIGVLYGKEELLAGLDPVEFGGEMVDVVTSKETTFEKPPLRFEAGTPNYVGAIALGAAMDYLEDVGREDIREREHELTLHAEKRLQEVEGLRILGSPRRRGGCVSFTIDAVHPFDLATLMDTQGFALRSGNQCAQPLLHETFGIQNITRLSPAFYNTFAEIDSCVDALKRVAPMLQAARGRLEENSVQFA